MAMAVVMTVAVAESVATTQAAVEVVVTCDYENMVTKTKTSKFCRLPGISQSGGRGQDLRNKLRLPRV